MLLLQMELELCKSLSIADSSDSSVDHPGKKNRESLLLLDMINISQI